MFKLLVIAKGVGGAQGVALQVIEFTDKQAQINAADKIREEAKDPNLGYLSVKVIFL